MKKKKLFALCLVFVLLVLASCGEKNASESEEIITAENEKLSDKSKIDTIPKYVSKEMQKLEKSANIKKDKKIIAGSRDVAEILSTIGYDNVVAVTDDATEFYPDAINIGKAENPDYSLLGDMRADLFIGDFNVEYESSPMNMNDVCDMAEFYGFGNEEMRNHLIVNLGESVGMRNIAMEAYGIEDEDIETRAPLKHALRSEEEKEKSANTKKDLRVVAGSRNVAEILSTIGYDNVIAVTDDATEFYPDAINIGKAENPDYDIIKRLGTDVFITDVDVAYEISPVDSDLVHCSTKFYNFENERYEKYAIANIGRSVGMRNIAMKAYGIGENDLN